MTSTAPVAEPTFSHFLTPTPDEEPDVAVLAAAAGGASHAPWPLTSQSLVVLSHGLDGCPGELGALASFLAEDSPAEILSPDVNVTRTHDGVLSGGRRLAEFIRRHVDAHPGRFRDITLVGMSLGGVYCRVAAGLLFDKRAKTVAGLQPRLLLTIATPHLGVGCWGALGALPRGAVRAYARAFLGRTEQELLLLDDEGNGGNDGAPCPSAERGAPPPEASAGGSEAEEELRGHRPLLLALSRHDSTFHAALASFRARVAYANCCNDLLVPFETAALLPDGPLPAGAPSPLFGEPRVVSDSVSASGGGSGEATGDLRRRQEDGGARSTGGGAPTLALAREMAAPLASLPWRRVAVAVPGLLPTAHCSVTAHRGTPLNAWLYRHGEPLVRHQAEAVMVLVEAAPAGGGRLCDAAGVAMR